MTSISQSRDSPPCRGVDFNFAIDNLNDKQYWETKITSSPDCLASR